MNEAQEPGTQHTPGKLTAVARAKVRPLRPVALKSAGPTGLDQGAAPGTFCKSPHQELKSLN